MLNDQQISSVTDEIKENPKVDAILLTGSYARGKATEKSDLDLRMVTNDGSNWMETDQVIDGVKIEAFYNSPDRVRFYLNEAITISKLDAAHFWSFGKVVYDPSGIAKILQNEARDILRSLLRVEIAEDLSKQQKDQVQALQKLTFTDVSQQEAEEDFYHPSSAHALAYIGNQLVGWAGINEVKQVFEGKTIQFGGYGICTHPDFQGIGIASKVSKLVMDYLKSAGVEVAFLSVDPTNIASMKLHTKNGFVLLPRKFSWTNSKGELKDDDGAMIAPVNSQELFEFILNGNEVLYIGNGYW